MIWFNCDMCFNEHISDNLCFIELNVCAVNIYVDQNRTKSTFVKLLLLYYSYYKLNKWLCKENCFRFYIHLSEKCVLKTCHIWQ